MNLQNTSSIEHTESLVYLKLYWTLIATNIGSPWMAVKRFNNKEKGNRIYSTQLD